MQPMMAHEQHRHDIRHRPFSTSRTGYRLQRFFLSRRWVILSRFVLPAIVVIWILGRLIVSGIITDQISAVRNGIYNSVASLPIFTIEQVEVIGADPELEKRLTDAFTLDLPRSSLLLDIDGIRDGLADMDEIGGVTVRTPMNGTMQIYVTLRDPVVAFANRGEMTTLDIEGHRVERLLSRDERPSLPVISGAGAENAVAEAVRIYRTARPIWSDIRGLVRRGERRWDVVMMSGVRIALPVEDPESALRWVLDKNESDDILARRIAVIDMRQPSQPRMRLQESYYQRLLGDRMLEDEG